MKCIKCEKETKTLVNRMCLRCAAEQNLVFSEKEFKEIEEDLKRRNNEKSTD